MCDKYNFDLKDTFIKGEGDVEKVCTYLDDYFPNVIGYKIEGKIIDERGLPIIALQLITIKDNNNDSNNNVVNKNTIYNTRYLMMTHPEKEEYAMIVARGPFKTFTIQKAYSAEQAFTEYLKNCGKLMTNNQKYDVKKLESTVDDLSKIVRENAETIKANSETIKGNSETTDQLLSTMGKLVSTMNTFMIENLKKSGNEEKGNENTDKKKSFVFDRPFSHVYSPPDSTVSTKVPFRIDSTIQKRYTSLGR